ncbi:MAG: FAD-dependent oxidoreductase [Pseudomonadota bacterium]
MTQREGPPPANVNYTFSEAELDQLRPFGDVRAHEKGAVLVNEGEARIDMLVTLSGQTDIIVDKPGSGPTRLGYMEAGQFAGDLGVLTGQASLVRVEMGEGGELLHIPFDRFQRLLVENSALSDVFIRTLTARRDFGRSRGISSVLIIGDAQDRSVFAARDLLTKHAIPHSWLAPETDALATSIMEARGIAKADLPVCVRGASRVLVKPTIEDLSEAFGLDLLPDGAQADVLVVGAGPAGLAASVYGASEGLSVLTLDTEGPGGQAGTSSKIENYLGFPMGVSGRELADRASVQAQKFGARIASPSQAKALRREEDGSYCMALRDGRTLKARAVVIATGAQYRRLPLDNLQQFEGRGIYYGATPMEAQLCGGQEVAVVGAGNSAGQGAMFLAAAAKAVHVVFRRADIRETMSEYLVRRLEEAPNIHLHPQKQISALTGVPGADPLDDRLSEVTWTNTVTGEETRHPLGFVFLFIGAAPFTEWLPATVSRDDKGFVKTGAELGPAELVRAGWALERMPAPFETSWPRVYAVGDVRRGSVKRVASAVGEGSVVVSDVHRALAEM